MTRHLIGWLLASLAVALLSGCETMSPQECKAANWHEVGMRDGINGEPLTMLDERVKDCAKAGTAVDTRSYMGGRTRGLDSYCQLGNAASLGVNGSAYHGVCPGSLDLEFRRRHQTGYAVFALRNQLGEMDERTRRLERRLHDADRDEDKQLREADKGDKADEQRKRIRRDFDERRRHLRRELGDIDRSVRSVRHDLRIAEAALDQLR